MDRPVVAQESDNRGSEIVQAQAVHAEQQRAAVDAPPKKRKAVREWKPEVALAQCTLSCVNLHRHHTTTTTAIVVIALTTRLLPKSLVH